MNYILHETNGKIIATGSMWDDRILEEGVSVAFPAALPDMEQYWYDSENATLVEIPDKPNDFFAPYPDDLNEMIALGAPWTFNYDDKVWEFNGDRYLAIVHSYPSVVINKPIEVDGVTWPSSAEILTSLRNTIFVLQDLGRLPDYWFGYRDVDGIPHFTDRDDPTIYANALELFIALRQAIEERDVYWSQLVGGDDGSGWS